MPGFIETMKPLFEHFQKHGIRSSLEPDINYDNIMRLLMEAELDTFSFVADNNEYTIDFTSDEIDEDIVYYILFGNDINPSAHSVLIELWVYGRVFLRLSIESARFIPLAMGFVESDGLLPVRFYDHGSGSEKIKRVVPVIMSDEEFHHFLQANPHQGLVVGIEVD